MGSEMCIRDSPQGACARGALPSPGPHVFAKVIAEYFPRVSQRRTVIIFSSLWRVEGERIRIPDHAMNDLLRSACRANDMKVTKQSGSEWTAQRQP